MKKFTIVMRPEWNKLQRVKVSRGMITVATTVAASAYDFPSAAAIEISDADSERVAINFQYDFQPSEPLAYEKHEKVTVGRGRESGRVMRLEFPMDLLHDVDDRFRAYYHVDPASTLPGGDIRRNIHNMTVADTLTPMADMIEQKLKEMRGGLSRW
jgi:hypothetical protein